LKPVFFLLQDSMRQSTYPRTFDVSILSFKLNFDSSTLYKAIC
jgi:hypothetical protein